MDSRTLVYKTLEFDRPKRVPRQLWLLPWASENYPVEVDKINDDFPADFAGVGGFYSEVPDTKGDPYEIGEYIDEWGCKFKNRQQGVIGEVKEPLVTGENWEDRDKINIPYEYLKVDIDKVNDFCNNTDKFVMAGACPRPFERLQFIRGTEQLYIDLALKNDGLLEIIKDIHQFYCDQLEIWAKTEVDALNFMDDWGSQETLLINPKTWEEIFKPLYRDYINIAHSNGKKIFMHSDGYILDIYPHLIEMGLDAINSQLFCMGIENLKKYKGKITFWGEIDRQHLLPAGSSDEIEEAVIKVKEHLWDHGGCIAQCEFGPGARPENVYKVFETWNSLI